MPAELIEDICREVDERAEAIRLQLNRMVHRRRFLRNYLKVLAATEDSPENYAEVVLSDYQEELEQSEVGVRELRAQLAAWRVAQKRLKALMEET